MVTISQKQRRQPIPAMDARPHVLAILEKQNYGPKEQKVVELLNEDFDRQYFDHPIMPMPILNPKIRKGVTPFPKCLKCVPQIRSLMEGRNNNHLTFDL